MPRGGLCSKVPRLLLGPGGLEPIEQPCGCRPADGDAAASGLLVGDFSCTDRRPKPNPIQRLDFLRLEGHISLEGFGRKPMTSSCSCGPFLGLFFLLWFHAYSKSGFRGVQSVLPVSALLPFHLPVESTDFSTTGHQGSLCTFRSAAFGFQGRDRWHSAKAQSFQGKRLGTRISFAELGHVGLPNSCSCW